MVQAPRDAELWTASRVAELRGYTGPAAAATARKWLSRQGIDATGREPGRKGENLYPAGQVQEAHAASPGSGRHGATRSGGGRFIYLGVDGDEAPLAN